MTDKIVFDASAILALVHMEPGHEIAAENLDNAIVSSVNFCEAVILLSRKGKSAEEVAKFLKETFLHIEDFDTEQSIVASSLDEFTKNHGLSLGDKACLALAKTRNLPVLTADKIWKELKLGIKVKLIR